MNPQFLLLLCILMGFSSCKKEEFDFKKPQIIWKESWKDQLGERSSISSPILYKDFLIISVRDLDNNTSSFYKYSIKDKRFIEKWEEEVFWSLDHVTKYLYNNQLIFNLRNTQIASVDLETMTTAWKIDVPHSSDHILPFKNKVYALHSDAGLQRYVEINLDTQQKRLVFSSTPMLPSAGIFGEWVKPAIYLRSEGDTAILTTTRRDSASYLQQYSITMKEMVWEVELTHFDSSSEGPARSIQYGKGLVFVNSNDWLACYNISDGSRIWQKSMDVSHHVSDPLLTEDKLFFATNKLYCLDASTGETLWHHEDEKNGLAWGSGAKMTFLNDIFFLFNHPIRVNEGLPYWLDIDRWGNSEFEFFDLPALEPATGNLYYRGRDEIFYIKNPQ